MSNKEFNKSCNDSDDNDVENDLINEGDNLQNIVITDVDAEGNEVYEVLSEFYSPIHFSWFTDPSKVDNFKFTVTPGLNILPVH